MSNKPQLTDIVKTHWHDVYPRIDPRKGGPLQYASKDKILLITGASKGIGRSIALSHAPTHPKTIILTARTTDQLDSVASEIAAIDSNIKVIKGSVDVTDAQAVNTFFVNLREVEEVGRMDVLFNNAGYLEPCLPFAQQDIADWTRTIETNIIGVGNVTHQFLRHNFMTVGGSPDGTTEGKNKTALKNVSVITTSSFGAIACNPGLSAYQPSKTWTNRFTQFLDAEYGTLSSFGEEGLRALCFHPGSIPTDLAQNLPKAYLDHWRENGHDSLELSGAFTAWLLTPEADFLRGRYASATWDVDELVAMKQEILDKDMLKVRVGME